MKVSPVLRRLPGLLPSAIVALAVVMLVAFAAVAPGFPVRKLDLNDSGIWVTNDAEALFGRLNKSAEALDGLLGPAGGAQGVTSFELDIAQDAAAVVARDLRSGRVTSLDVAGVTHRTDRGGTIDPTFAFDMRGGTAAVLDPGTGRVWAVRYAADNPVIDVPRLEASQKVVADLGPAPDGVVQGQAAGLSVGLDGVVHAVSTNGTVAIIRPTADGFADPEYRDGPERSSVQVAAIGSDHVVLDAQAGELTAVDGRTHDVGSDPEARLQQAAGAATQVVVATTSALLGIGRETTQLAEGNGAAPAQPVVLAGCAFAAWPGEPGLVVRSCDGVPASGEPGAEALALRAPAFRTNHGQIVLNDTSDGKIYSFEEQRYVQNWDDTQPQESSDQGDPNRESRARDDVPPHAGNDVIGARPGRTTVAHVLDNDADQVGRILAVTSVTQPTGGTTASIAPDGQTVLVTLPEGAQNSFFHYTISNGAGTATARVDVQVRGDEQNEAPHLRAGAETRTFSVASWGTIVLPALGDWRDEDGDPVAVESVTAGDHKVGTTTDGRITFTAPRVTEPTIVPIAYQVSDGRAEPVAATMNVKVLAYDATNGDAPITEPDAVRGETGRPILVRPLANDIPGADPLNPRATLELASRVQAVDGLEVETDLKSGELVVTAQEARTYFLEYTAKFGAAKFAQGNIRIDVTEPGPSRPTASPDHVTIRGMAPAMVDALANDSDPTGSLLTVQSAQAADRGVDGGQLQVAVLKGRWVRIMPRTERLDPNPQVVHYTISNGLGDPVQGTITVTQLPDPRVDEAIIHDDFATVRAGDTVLSDVLANDTSTSGQELVIDRNTPGLPAGQLVVKDPNLAIGAEATDVGRAYVVNDQVRYVAPEVVDAPREVRVEYQASVAGGTPQTGVLTITVNPAPTDEAPNQAPAPQNLEARASSGQTIEIPIQPWGQDPDGDTVTVLGLATPPTKGRVLGFTPNALTYQAYPHHDNGGTDTFRYLVTDAWGATEAGIVRVAITPPGDVQPPVAVADVVTAEPDTDIQLHPMTNDMVDEADRATIVPFEAMGNQVPEGVELTGTTGPITGRTPGRDDLPVQFAYALESSGGVGPAASVTIRSQPGYLNPPRLYDTVAEAKGTVATADVLERAWDPDGPTSDLRVSSVSHPEATVAGGTITVPLAERTQVVSYEVADRTGATSSAVVFVPSAGAGLPFLKPGSLIEMSPNSSHSFDLSEYVESPRKEPVRLTVAESLTASPSQLTLSAESAERLTVTASADYVGPASVTFEVIDGDPESGGRTAIITIPVQVGPATPVLRCPPSTQRLVQGGAPVNLRISAVCSVWTPNPADAETLEYSAELAGGLPDVQASGDVGTVTVVAGSNAVPGSTGVLRIGVAGSPATPQEVTVEVVAAPKPTLVVRDIDDIKQGTAVTQQIQLSSPLRKPTPQVVEISQVGGMDADWTFNGSSFTITPGSQSSGVMTFRVVATDVADKGRTDRHVTATLTLTVYGIPDIPTPPQPAMQLRSKSASVTYTPGSDNGAPITRYRVEGGGKTLDCGRATRCDITGLENGTPVSFRVQAENKAGWSEWSQPGPSVTPNEIPGRVPTFSAGSPSDGSLVLTWAPAINEGSAVTKYVITYGGQTLEAPGSATSATVRGLNNNATYTFTILAQNAAGMSQQPTSTTGQSSGRPRLSTLNVAASDLGATAQVSVSWTAADPQGPRPVTYNLTRTGGTAGTRTWTGLTGTSVADSLTYDGSSYTYAVTATNATGGPSHTSAALSKQFTAMGKPAAWGAWSATATGVNGQLSLSYTVPPSRGGSSTVTLTGAGGTRTMAAGSGTSSTTFNGVLVGGLTNGQGYALQLRVCNEGGACSASSTVSATPYGPLSDPTLNASANADTITWSASGNGNGRNAVLRVSDSVGTPSVQGAGALSLPSTTRTVGYSKTVTITATLSDPAGGRATRTVSRQVTTGPAPPPPKPPDPPQPVRTVTVWKGSRAVGKECTYYADGGACFHVGITTANFSGTYQCTILGTHNNRVFSTVTYTGDTRRENSAYYGFDATVVVNCDGVRGSLKW